MPFIERKLSDNSGFTMSSISDNFVLSEGAAFLAVKGDSPKNCTTTLYLDNGVSFKLTEEIKQSNYQPRSVLTRSTNSNNMFLNSNM